MRKGAHYLALAELVSLQIVSLDLWKLLDEVLDLIGVVLESSLGFHCSLDPLGGYQITMCRWTPGSWKAVMSMHPGPLPATFPAP